MYNIYLLEDEQDLNTILTTYLKAEGWNIKSFTDGLSAVKHIQEEPHLWILDINLPDIDGFEVIKQIKTHNDETPVIFISARDRDIDRVIGLEMGSDDYLPKPFLPIELVIRCRKLLKRLYASSDGNKSGANAIVISDYSLDSTKRKISYKSQDIDLTSREFDLLHLFFSNKGCAFSREQILTKIWGDDYFGSDRVVDDLVRRIRKKIEHLNLETIYGFGYRLNEV